MLAAQLWNLAQFCCGITHANGTRMAARRYRELFAWQLADEFKKKVADIVRASPEASRDFRYRSQLLESSRAAAKDIAEGFMRRSALQFAGFLDYAVGSLAEAEERLIDGIQLDYFRLPECREALVLAKRCTKASIKLKESQIRYAQEQRKRRKSGGNRKDGDQKGS
jgi:four helix bundle protein